MRVDKDNNEWKVKGISFYQNEQKKWYLFEEEFQSPSKHPLFEKKIKVLKCKNYRNFDLEKETLKEYLNFDRTKFEFCGKQLVEDCNNSIKEEGKKKQIFQFY